MAGEAELLEIKKIGDDVKSAIADFKGKLEEKASTEDVESQLKGMKESYKEALDTIKKQGEDISSLTVKMNRERLPFGGGEGEMKNLQGQLIEELTAESNNGVQSS